MARFSPASMPPWRRGLWVTLWLAPWAAALGMLIDLGLVGGRIGAPIPFGPGFLSSWVTWTSIQLGFFIPISFVLMRGRIPDGNELEELAITRLRREDVTIGVLYAPLRLCLSLACAFLITVPIPCAYQVTLGATQVGWGAPDLWESLFDSVAATLWAIWMILIGTILCAGMTCALRRFHPVLIALWPVVGLALLPATWFGYELAKSWIEPFFRDTGGRWFDFARPRFFAAIVNYALSALLHAAVLVVVSRVGLGGATDSFWRPCEESPEESPLPYRRERAASSSPGIRARLAAIARETLEREAGAARAPARLLAVLLGCAVPATLLVSVHPARDWLWTGDGPLHAAAVLFSNAFTGAALPAAALPLACAVWAGLRRAGHSLWPSGEGARFPITFAGCLLAGQSRFLRLHLGLVAALLTAHWLGTSAPWWRCVSGPMLALAFALVLSVAALVTTCGAASGKRAAALWCAALITLWGIESLALGGTPRTTLLHPSIQTQWGYTLVLLPFALGWLLLDAVPRAARRLREHEGPGTSTDP